MVAGWFALSLIAGMLSVPDQVRGNETDQFILPTDREMVDVGSVISAAHFEVLEDYVNRANAKIRDAIRDRDEEHGALLLRNAQSPLTVANHVRAAFGAGFFETLELENAFRSRDAKEMYANELAAYKTSKWVYSTVHLPIDPRKIPLSVPSSTIRVYDHYIGTDKFGHFHDLGHLYHKDYVNLLDSGVAQDEALRRVVKAYSRGPISEAGGIGFFATGVFSNGDLAANYLGFKFYRNLTEPVMLQGKEQPPMLVRHGGYWSLNTHVRPDSDFFRVFVSDHFNEALNPNIYEWGAAGPISKKLRDNADQILTFYADENGQKRPKAWFEDKAVSLLTYYGEDYGHSGLKDATVTIASCCFEDESESSASDSG